MKKQEKCQYLRKEEKREGEELQRRNRNETKREEKRKKNERKKENKNSQFCRLYVPSSAFNGLAVSSIEFCDDLQ